MDMVDAISLEPKATLQMESGCDDLRLGRNNIHGVLSEAVYYSFRTGMVSHFQLLCQIWSRARYPGLASRTGTICEVWYGVGVGHKYMYLEILAETIRVYPWIKCTPGQEGLFLDFTWGLHHLPIPRIALTILFVTGMWFTTLCGLLFVEKLL